MLRELLCPRSRSALNIMAAILDIAGSKQDGLRSVECTRVLMFSRIRVVWLIVTISTIRVSWLVLMISTIRVMWLIVTISRIRALWLFFMISWIRVLWLFFMISRIRVLWLVVMIVKIPCIVANFDDSTNPCFVAESHVMLQLHSIQKINRFLMVMSFSTQVLISDTKLAYDVMKSANSLDQLLQK